MPRKIPGWMPVEPGEPNASQIVDGQWYAPEHGCDSLGITLDSLDTDWISVADELPPADQDVILWDGHRRSIGYYSSASRHWVSRGDRQPTHWAWLLWPPEADDGA